MPAVIESTLHRVFCQNLRAARDAKGLTQEQAAKRLGMEQAQYSRLENGVNAPNILMIERLAIGLGVTVEALLGFVHEEQVA